MNRTLALRSTVDLVHFAAAHGIGTAPLGEWNRPPRCAPATHHQLSRARSRPSNKQPPARGGDGNPINRSRWPSSGAWPRRRCSRCSRPIEEFGGCREAIAWHRSCIGARPWRIWTSGMVRAGCVLCARQLLAFRKEAPCRRDPGRQIWMSTADAPRQTAWTPCTRAVVVTDEKDRPRNTAARRSHRARADVTIAAAL